MFVRQNSCIPIEDGSEGSIPVHAVPSTPVAESPAVPEDKLKVKSR